MSNKLTPEQAMQVCNNGGLVGQNKLCILVWYKNHLCNFVLINSNNNLVDGEIRTFDFPKHPHPDYDPSIFAKDYSPGKCLLIGPEAKTLLMSAPPGMLWACTGSNWDDRLAEWWDGKELQCDCIVRWGYYPDNYYEIRVRPQWLIDQEARFSARNFKPYWIKESIIDKYKYIEDLDGRTIYIHENKIKIALHDGTAYYMDAVKLRDMLLKHFPISKETKNTT